MNRNHAFAKTVTHKGSVIARSETTKQSVLAVWEIATGLRPRNDSRVACQLNYSEMNYAPMLVAVSGDLRCACRGMVTKSNSSAISAHSAVDNCFEVNSNE
jgi:hypothetical protein